MIFHCSILAIIYGSFQMIVPAPYKRTGVSLLITLILLLLSILFLSTKTTAEGVHTFLIGGRTEISKGLPEKASFSSVEVYDADGNGLDELYVGGAGRISPKTPGIRAFEYNAALGEWKEFGHGLPGKNSDKYYGALSFGDVDNDGNVDLIAPLLTKWYDGDKNGIEVYRGDGAGGFSLKYTIDNDESANEAELADLDGDGYLDIAVSTEYAVRVWYGSGTVNGWSEKSPPRSGNEITGIGVGDLNADGLLDLVGCPYFNSETIRMYVQSSNRTWEEISFKEVRREAFGIKIIDVDIDGNSDIIYGTRNEGIKVWLGNNGGSPGGTDFQWSDGSMGLHDSGGTWDQLELRDITGDGKPELIAASNGGDDIYLYINDQPNGWTWIFRGDVDSNDPLFKEIPLTMGGEPYGANFGDWDGNGRLDAAACSWGTGVKAWLINNYSTPDGTDTNQTGPIAYPEGGETPLRIWGFDDYLYLKAFLIGGIGLAMLVALVIWIKVFVANIIRKRKKDRKEKESRKDWLWFFKAGNISVIIGIVFLFISQVIAIKFSMNYEPDAKVLFFWDPYEFIGVLLCSFLGFIAFLISFEIGRFLSLKGISKLENYSDVDDDLCHRIKRSRASMKLSYISAYLSIIILFLVIMYYVFTETENIYIITLPILLVPLSILFFNFSNNIISDGARIKKIPKLTILTSSIMILLTIILSMIGLASGWELKVILMIYPIIFGILIIAMAVLNIVTMGKSRKLILKE